METIVTDQLIIRHFHQDDWQDLYSYLADPDVVAVEPYDIYTAQQAKEEAVRRSKDKSFYAVCLKENEKLIGNLYLGKGDFTTRELGYVFHKQYHGQGSAFTECLL